VPAARSRLRVCPAQQQQRQWRRIEAAAQMTASAPPQQQDHRIAPMAHVASFGAAPSHHHYLLPPPPLPLPSQSALQDPNLCEYRALDGYTTFGTFDTLHDAAIAGRLPPGSIFNPILNVEIMRF
ncbi:hypothetical protein BC828DRAFT_406679, partial [Blastocladiella britannica]